MEIRLFDKQKDYKTLCEWWDAWNLPTHPVEALSETGVIISKDNIDVCSGFIYRTDSYIAWLEFVTINKKTTKKQREGVLKKLGEVLIEKAKTMGFKLIMCFGLEQQNNKSPILAKWRKENMGDIMINDITQYYKIIN